MNTNYVVCSDNVTHLSTLPDECIDMVCTSPPYDNLRDYESGYSLDIVGLGEQLYRVIKPGGVCVWVVGDATINGVKSGTSFRTVLQFMDIGWNLWDTLIYYRRGVWQHKKRFRNDHEYMFVFVKGNKLAYYDKTPVDVPNPKAGQSYRCGGSRKKDGTTGKPKTLVYKDTKCNGTIFDYNFGGDGTKLKKQHPATFPNKLALDMVEIFCPPGGIVLDPFNGSGTTCVAAKSSGREYIGIDMSEEYVSISERRLLEETITRDKPSKSSESQGVLDFMSDS